MLTGNNLDLLDEAVQEHQSRIQEAARDARDQRQRSREAGEHSLRVRIGDRLIGCGVSIRGGFPDAPVRRHRQLAAHS